MVNKLANNCSLSPSIYELYPELSSELSLRVMLPPRKWTPAQRQIDLKDALLAHVFVYGYIGLIDGESIGVCRELVKEGVFREPKWNFFEING